MSLLVVDPGFFTTIQDLGRPGSRAFGVPLGGAADRESLMIANALAGNPAGLAALEMTIRGGTFEALSDLGVALAGARVEAEVLGAEGRRRVAVPGSAAMRRGDRLAVGRMEGGARTYLATPGGFGGEAWMGSRSAEAPLKAGEILPAGPGRLAWRRPADVASDDASAPIRLLPGPDWSLLLDPDELTRAPFRVDPRSNRMGLRLGGPTVAATPTPERLSAPVTPGAAQVAGGTLIVLGVACGTMGGYPHVAQVISADLDRLGRLRPGDPICFAPVTLSEARRLDRDRRDALHARANRIRWAARDGAC
ncbi:biotin-dependent carboxyltransferase family protein [Paludisphaera sp.]|uniref:5-oxoprolinase subunit C family protein n=1 Tax=Paludisphaera sp. TaxID=2017432 RepID=UPI00301C81F6